MRNSSIAIIGVVLLLVGAIGIAAVFLLGGTAFMSGPLYESAAPDAPDTTSRSVGEHIYYEGVGDRGPIQRTGGIGRMGSGGCITCHGPDGQGGSVGMMGALAEAPPITYEVLTGAHGEHDSDDEPDEAWTDADIARAVRDGVTPSGERLDPIMPRWDMDDMDMEALIEYLKVLG